MSEQREAARTTGPKRAWWRAGGSGRAENLIAAKRPLFGTWQPVPNYIDLPMLGLGCLGTWGRLHMISMYIDGHSFEHEHEHKGCLLACRSTAHSGGRLVSGGERGEGPRTARCCRLIRRPLSLTRNAETVASRGGWSAWWCRTSRRPCLRVSLVCTPCFKRAYIKMWLVGIRALPGVGREHTVT